MKQDLLSVSSSGSQHLILDATANFHATAGTVVVSAQGLEVRAVFRNGTVWMASNLTQFVRTLPAGKTWVSGSVRQLESVGAFQPLSDSLAILDGLRGAENLRTTARGTATFDLSLSRALAQTPASRRGALLRTIHANGGGLKYTGAVSLSPEGIVRSETLRIAGSGQTAGLHLQISLALSAVGAPVSVTPPPAKEVVPLNSVPSLERLLLSSASSG